MEASVEELPRMEPDDEGSDDPLLVTLWTRRAGSDGASNCHGATAPAAGEGDSGRGGRRASRVEEP
jgi:hypothetical protein